MSIEASAMALSGTINQFGMEAGEANRVINVLATGAKFGGAEVAELAQSFKATGGTASALGVSLEATSRNPKRVPPCETLCSK